MILGSTKPLTEMSTRKVSWGLMCLVRKTEIIANILGHCHVIWDIYLSGNLWGPWVCNGTNIRYNLF